MLNEKFDTIKDPYRFYIFMGLMSPGFILMVMQSVTQNPVYFLAGIVYVLVLGGFRIYYVEFMKDKKEKGNGS